MARERRLDGDEDSVQSPVSIDTAIRTSYFDDVYLTLNHLDSGNSSDVLRNRQESFLLQETHQLLRSEYRFHRPTNDLTFRTGGGRQWQSESARLSRGYEASSFRGMIANGLALDGGFARDSKPEEWIPQQLALEN